MPWVEFTSDFDWEPVSKHGKVVVAYKAGMKMLVTSWCARAALNANRAIEIERPPDVKQKYLSKST